MNKEIEEIEKEVNGEYTYINSFKAIEYMKTLLSKIKELETDDRSRSERFIEIGDKYESLKFKVFDLEEKMKELENKNKGLEMSMPKDPDHSDCIIVLKSGFDAFLYMAKEEVKQAEARLKEITEKWISLKFKVFDLEEQFKIKDEVIETLKGQISYGLDDAAKERIKRLQEERDGYKNGQIQLQGMVDDLMDVNTKWAKRAEKLEEAVDQHEIFKRAHEKIVALEDEALYLIRKEEGMSDE